MLKEPISITALTSISALGQDTDRIWKTYQNEGHCLSELELNGKKVWAAPLPQTIGTAIENLRNSDHKYANLDDTVVFAIYTARKALQQAGWGVGTGFGINLGSSRGATQLMEKFHKTYLNQGDTPTLTSPTTTLGNISSWVGHDLKSHGPVISHSITCSTALHALLNAVAWIQSGMTDKFMVGGSEAPLTDFTIAQMQALKIYSRLSNTYPCRALDLDKKRNSMVLGEGAAMACLEKGNASNVLARICGIGYATEPLEHNVSISTEAQCFQDSMKMAMGARLPEEVDAVVMHAPGTVKGDLSEFRAIESVFGKSLPFLATNKWKVGHTFGASGLLSVEMAVLMIQNQEGINNPFYENEHRDGFNTVLVNAVGFGGNAVSILLERPTN